MNAAPTPTVGVAIPYWSGPDYLAAALESLIAQTDGDFTAVVIDDCSPDGGAEKVVTRLADPRIRFVRNERNLGLSANFNKCLTEPGTDVIAILHADDLLEPGYVATIRAAHSDRPDAACVAPWTTPIDGDGRVAVSLVDRVKHWRWPAEQRSELSGDAGLARLMHTFLVYTPAMSYRPSLLPPDPFSPLWRQVMDVELYANLLLDGGVIVFDRSPSYRYRRHPGTVTSHNERSFTRLGEETEMARAIAARARQLGWPRTRFAAWLRWSIRLNGLVSIASSVGHSAPGRARALLRVVSLR